MDGRIWAIKIKISYLDNLEESKNLDLTNSHFKTLKLLDMK